MTTTFDIDELERLLAATKYVFSHVEDYAEAVEAYHAGLRKAAPAMITEIRELRAENARMKTVVCNYVDPFDVAPEDEALVERVQRAALGEPQ